MGWPKSMEDNREARDGRFYQPLGEQFFREDVMIQMCAIISAPSYPDPPYVRNRTDKSEVRSGKVLQCKDCGREFLFSKQQQRSFQRKGFVEPKRCQACRALRKRVQVTFEEEGKVC